MKNPVEILKVNNIKTEVKSSVGGIKSRTEAESVTWEIKQDKTLSEKQKIDLGQEMNRAVEARDCDKIANICIIDVLEGCRKEGAADTNWNK